MAKPIPVNAYSELFNKIGKQAIQTHIDSSGKIKTQASVDITSAYDVDNNGNLVLDAGGDTVIPASVPAKAKIGATWRRNRTTAKDGAIKINWRLEWADETKRTE